MAQLSGSKILTGGDRGVPVLSIGEGPCGRGAQLRHGAVRPASRLEASFVVQVTVRATYDGLQGLSGLQHSETDAEADRRY